MEILSMIVGVIGGALGAFSILVTWKLYQAGNETHMKVLELLSEIRQSSHTAEVTSTHFTERLLELLQRDVTSSLAFAQRDVTQRINAELTQNLKGIDQNVVKTVRSKVLRDVRDTFKTLTLETAAAAQLGEPQLALARSDAKPEPIQPAAMRVLSWVVRNEDKYPFFSVKFVRERIFVHDPPGQQGLQFCIDNGFVELYEVPNPRKPAHPVKALRLNRNHPVVRQMLG